MIKSKQLTSTQVMKKKTIVMKHITKNKNERRRKKMQKTCNDLGGVNMRSIIKTTFFQQVKKNSIPP